MHHRLIDEGVAGRETGLAGVRTCQPDSATRHLCLGVHLDRSFRDLVIRRVHNDSRRRVAPSYGFDLVPVVRHAWISWGIETLYHVGIVVTLLAALRQAGGLTTLLVIAVVVDLLLVYRIASLGAEVVRMQVTSTLEHWRERRQLLIRNETPRSLLDKRKRLLKVLAASFAVAVLASGSLAILADGPVGATVGRVRTILGCLVVWAVVIGVVRQMWLNAVHAAASLGPRRRTRREQVIADQQAHPVVPYERPRARADDDLLFGRLGLQEEESPFLGSGTLVNRWLPPMTVQLLRPGGENMKTREHVTAPFLPHELVDELRKEMGRLISDTGPDALADLEIRDRIYVAEADVAAVRPLLQGRLTGEGIDQIINNPRSAAQHFLEASVPIAGGELVTTVLLRVSVKGRCLSLDVATCALPRTGGHSMSWTGTPSTECWP